MGLSQVKETCDSPFAIQKYLAEYGKILELYATARKKLNDLFSSELATNTYSQRLLCTYYLARPDIIYIHAKLNLKNGNYHRQTSNNGEFWIESLKCRCHFDQTFCQMPCYRYRANNDKYYSELNKLTIDCCDIFKNDMTCRLL